MSNGGTTTVSDFYAAIKERRSIYAISKESPISDERIQEVVEYAINHTPSAFNSQSSRAVILLHENHNKLWDITKETLRKVVGEGDFSGTEEKMASFRNGYGTVLFFEDQSVVEYLQEQFALYKDNFPVWSNQSSGMLQYNVWTAFSIEGLGASLQHYNPLIDDEVKKEWGIPDSWKLIAQLPFGKPAAPAGEKEFAPIDTRLKVFK
ncbi:nitroreductase family protein [Bacillus horti]|uniref:Oxidoreductase (Fatty acid repression mutant protein) n=1 Tax=Caldalkalibacillus horti TaxID=77523 RepID=A0ABT9W450_9BACI|nr:nitroreductase family protein [Bacillus horti]MDQ0167915.1 putative oxidoreductase (fatty acid repression mutant protein) [Bacillus horti]